MLSPLAPNTTQELLNQIAKLEQQLHKQPGSNETGTCISTNHAEVEGNDTILTAMIIIVTGIIIVTISFEWAKEEWERRMHASLKAVVKNVFCKSFINFFFLCCPSPVNSVKILRRFRFFLLFFLCFFSFSFIQYI